MNRDELIKELAKLYTGLQVPISIHMPLGTAEGAWKNIKNGIPSFGWASPEEIEQIFTKILDSES